jgi:PAS domain S-box-containing protein
MAIAVSDAQAPGLPLVMVNRAFESLTGYSAGEVLGYNCRFLQCAQSEPDVQAKLVDALRSMKPIDVRITNRRKDGSLFINLLSMRPIFDAATGMPRIIFASLREETKAHLAGVQAHLDSEILLASIPQAMIFSTPSPSPPLGASMRNDELSSATTLEERDACWVGAPLRHQLTALQRVLLLQTKTIGGSGAQLFLDFIRGHWSKLGRMDKACDSALDARLSLHSDNAIAHAYATIIEIVDFSKETQSLLDGSVAFDARSAKIHELYNAGVRLDRSAVRRDPNVWKARIRARKSVRSGKFESRSGGDTEEDNDSDTRSINSDARSINSADPYSEYGSGDEDALSVHLQSDTMRSGPRSTAASSAGGTSVYSAAQSSAGLDDEVLLSRIMNHNRTLQTLLVFDAWRDLLLSPEGESMQQQLSESADLGERRLGEQIMNCMKLQPQNTDDWMRLFISCVQENAQIGVCICDTSLAFAPIIHANKGFQTMSGYSLEELVGKSCRMMQGAKSDPASVQVISDAMRAGSRAVVRLINYRKDGSLFNNMATLRPIFDREGHMVFMVSISIEVVDRFKRMKPLLTQVNRLDNLLPETIDLPSPASVRQRLSVGQEAMLAARASMKRKLKEATSNATVSKQADALSVLQQKETLLASDIAVKRAKERIADRKRRSQEDLQARLEGPMLEPSFRSVNATQPASKASPSSRVHVLAADDSASSQLPKIDHLGHPEFNMYRPSVRTAPRLIEAAPTRAKGASSAAPTPDRLTRTIVASTAIPSPPKSKSTGASPMPPRPPLVSTYAGMPSSTPPSRSASGAPTPVRLRPLGGGDGMHVSEHIPNAPASARASIPSPRSRRAGN